MSVITKTKYTYLIVLTILLIAFSFVTVFAHQGRTDGSGGHYDHSTGEYHYHHGYPAHQHENGECPYRFDDKTGQDSGGSGGSLKGGYSGGSGGGSSSISSNDTQPLTTALTLLGAILFGFVVWVSWNSHKDKKKPYTPPPEPDSPTPHRQAPEIETIQIPLCDQKESLERLKNQKEHRGTYVEHLLAKLDSALSINSIELEIVSTVTETCRDKMPDFAKAVGEILDFATGSDVLEIMEENTRSIDSHLQSLFFDDEIAKERISAALNDPSIIDLTDFANKVPLHIGFNFGVYWYAVTGLKPDLSTCARMNRFHANLIRETFNQIP